MDDTASHKLPNVKFTPEQRSNFRRAIVSHDDWKAWRLRNNASIADMSIIDMIRAAIDLGIDPMAFGTATDESRKAWAGRKGGSFEAKPRPYGEEIFYRLAATYDTLKSAMCDRDRDFADSILKTIRDKQDRHLTEGQHGALTRIFDRYSTTHAKQNEAAAHANNQAYEAAQTRRDTDTATYTAMQNEETATMFDTNTNATMATSNDSAATQLAALLATLAGQAMNPEQIARVVDERIARALASVPSVKFEVKGFDGQTRETEGHKHPAFAKLLRAATSKMANGYAPNIWIAGPTGSGKTHSCTMLAESLGTSFHIHGATEMTHELLGFIDANGHYHRTQFREAFELGGVVVLDEVDAWGPAALLALNSMIANGIGVFPDKQVTRHADCVIIGTANTWGLGATADYVGRSKIDAAFLSRFAVRIDWPYDTALEIAISGNEAWANRVIAARNRAKAAGLKVVICPRITQSGAALIANGATPDEAAHMTYLANVSPEQAKIIEGK